MLIILGCMYFQIHRLKMYLDLVMLLIYPNVTIYYLFYLFLMVMPALVFMLGLSFFCYYLVKESGVEYDSSPWIFSVHDILYFRLSIRFV